ncbi:MAG: nicotinate-nucleotide adenylyltransferase [Pseudomonadota bacterium]
MRRRRIAVLGGSFDPVHNGHVALGALFTQLLDADELRIVPAGDPWQKIGLQAPTSARLNMVEVAFADMPVAVTIDPQETLRVGATYTIDTLQALREEFGPEPSLALLIGADQLLRLHTWRRWREIFDHAHICVASRPGFSIEAGQLSPAVQEIFSQRLSTVGQVCEQSHGLSFLSRDLAIEVSATIIRSMLWNGESPEELVPARVLDYIQQHNLYKRP